MCANDGITGYFSNHSVKRMCATALYQAGVPEQEIMERTGNRSVESVRKYKRPSSEMLMEISNTLEPLTTTKIKPESVQNEEGVTVVEEVVAEEVVSEEDQRKVEKREERVSEDQDVVLEEDSAEFVEEEEASNIKSNKRKWTDSSSSASSDSEDHCNEMVKNGLEKVVSHVKSLNLDI